LYRLIIYGNYSKKWGISVSKYPATVVKGKKGAVPIVFGAALLYFTQTPLKQSE
jgi:hypothetical protein